MNKLILATGCDENYLNKMNFLFDSVKKNSNFDRNSLLFLSDKKVYIDGIEVHNVNINDIEAITTIKCLQHGEFLKSKSFFESINENDIIFFIDGDVVIQRFLTKQELDSFRKFKDNDVFIGYNMDQYQTLLDESRWIGPTFNSVGIFTEDWNRIKCYNTGVIAMNKKTWIKLMNQYIDWFPNLNPMFKHYAKQQWLISYIISTQNYNIIEMDYNIHNHNHNERVPTPYSEIDKKGVVRYKGEIVLFKHKWDFDKEYKMGYTQFTEDVFIVDCWTDTIEKENTLIELLTRLKVYNAPIILCGHYPVKPEIQKLVDYYLYDANNDILLEKDFEEFGINSDRWTSMGELTVTNKTEFHHDYAIWITMKNAFALAERLGKKYIHFLEFDNLPEEVQYRQSFMEYVRHNDAVVYEYSEGSTKENNPYSSTYIFSIKTDIANRLINTINSKEEYFKGKPDRWQLEKVFYQTLKSITNNIFISKYIPNDNELNIFAAWNRNGIIRNGARFQTYLAVDEYKQLFIHFISGFSEKPVDKDYIVEVVCGQYKRFHLVKKGEFHIDKIGEFIQGETVKVYYQGIEVFKQELKDEFEEFRRKNKLTRNTLIKKPSNPNKQTIVHFVDGPYVEIKEEGDFLYNVQFINKKNNTIEFEINLKSNHWARCNKKYYVDWLVKIKGIDNDYYHEHSLNLENRRVMICFESKSLGDNLAWVPYVEKFRQEHKCHVICSTFNNNLFKSEYPNIEFVLPGSTVDNVYSLYRLGVFYDDKRKIEESRHPNDPKKEPLMKVGSDILGLNYEELTPKLPTYGKDKKKLISIATHSTAQAKYWNNPTGWQDVVDYLIGEGYEVRLLSREEDGYMGNKNPKGVIQQPKGPLEEIIKVLQESELFIGISSGLSWLSWASGTPTIIISGFTDEDLEPTIGVTRIINKEVCNSCWSNYEFDPGDWNWCPVHKGTKRQFECSKTITSNGVIEKIRNLLGKK